MKHCKRFLYQLSPLNSNPTPPPQQVLRAARDHPDIEVVALNDPFVVGLSAFLTSASVC